MGKIDVNVISNIKNIYQVKGNVLGVIAYGTDKVGDLELELSSYPYQFIQMENIEKNMYEVWFTDENVTYKRYGSCMEGKSVHYCFRTVDINDSKDNHSENAEKAYREILHEMDFSTFRVVRFWNYIPGIVEHGESGEHYKEFCIGRERAFKNFYKENGEVYPAATGIGTKGNNLCIILLAVHLEVVRYSIENPRQVPAYQYPIKFGVCSPKFSRAAYVQYEKDKIMLLSGTASIVGSNSVHAGDVIKQLHTTIKNISLLFSEENLFSHSISTKYNNMQLRYIKVYIKNWADYSKVRAICEKYFDNEKIVYMQSDVCRRDLLIEIEGIWI